MTPSDWKELEKSISAGVLLFVTNVALSHFMASVLKSDDLNETIYLLLSWIWHSGLLGSLPTPLY